VAADSDQEKTEEPTPERRKKARDEGQFPRGKDAGNTAGSFFVILALVGLASTLSETLGEFAWRCFHEPYHLVRGDFQTLITLLGSVLGIAVLPFAAAAAIGATAAGIAEAGYHPKFDLIGPKWERLDPINKMKQMFSPQQAFVNIALQFGRVAVVAVVAYMTVEDGFPRLLRLSRASLVSGVTEVAYQILRLTLWSSLALTALVVLDYLYNRYKHEQQIKMSMQEVKDEVKQQEGDPRVRARQRAKAREIAKRSVVQAVAEADFVVANPTHVSVAIRYRAEEGAPQVAAKGYDEVALHIRELAKKHKIPIIENVPLARALALRVKVGRPIPMDLYATVAELLAFVYRMKNRSVQRRR
jgi:flagellar biosynthetic protein FlhB